MAKELLQKVKCWKNPDGSLRIFYFVKEAMLKQIRFPNGKERTMTEEMFLRLIPESIRNLCVVTPLETEDQFIVREVSKIKAFDPALNALPEIDVQMSDLPKKDRRKWRLKNGKIMVDPTVKTDEEKKNELKASAIQKLKAQNPALTDEELALMVR